ncbi:hypothetical protein C2845_PM10G03880 [Panicum miliaceum]|uniref:DUF4408 domain-containing protein n=1 Tax=Panicum miliaceum TaxID=4540 RepID=A0A3L6PGM3_PANMI|nr:hypothetical protein C2845_PM10G03880 [Panicum miliaceum]
MAGKLATSGRSHSLVERTKSHSLRASSAARWTDGITAVVAALTADRSGATALVTALELLQGRRKAVTVDQISKFDVATSVICLLLTSPAWFPRLCSLLTFFFLTILSDLVTAFLFSPKCLFIVGNLIVAFLVGEPRRDDDQPSLRFCRSGGAREEEEGEEKELHKRVEDFIARVKKQRKLEAKSFFDVDR